MSIVVRPATLARFGDVATMLGPKNPDSSVCWCLSHRLDSKTNRALIGRARGEYVKMLCGRKVAPGVLMEHGKAKPRLSSRQQIRPPPERLKMRAGRSKSGMHA